MRPPLQAPQPSPFLCTRSWMKEALLFIFFSGLLMGPSRRQRANSGRFCWLDNAALILLPILVGFVPLVPRGLNPRNCPPPPPYDLGDSCRLPFLHRTLHHHH